MFRSRAVFDGVVGHRLDDHSPCCWRWCFWQMLLLPRTSASSIMVIARPGLMPAPPPWPA
jgi:hypothetical protein